MSTGENDAAADLQEYIRQYLKYWELNSTLELFEDEIKRKVTDG